jgi:hypothetical protein
MAIRLHVYLIFIASLLQIFYFEVISSNKRTVIVSNIVQKINLIHEAIPRRF